MKLGWYQPGPGGKAREIVFIRSADNDLDNAMWKKHEDVIAVAGRGFKGSYEASVLS